MTMRTNLWPNPDFVPTGFHVSSIGKDVSGYMDGGRFQNTGTGYVDLPFNACEVGTEYVCCFNIAATEGENHIAIWSGSSSWKLASQPTGARTIRFTGVSSDTRIAVPPGMTIDSLIVETAATYDSGVGGGLPSFFTGDTMPLS